LKAFLTIVTLFVAVPSPKVFAKVIQQDLSSAEVRLLTELDDFVQGMQVFIFAPHRIVLVRHNEVL